MMLIYPLASSRPTMAGCIAGVDSQDAWPAFFAFVGVETC